MAPAPDSGNAPDPREAVQALLGAIRRNLVRVVFTTLVFLMIGIGLSMIWPSKYSSTTEFALTEPRIIVDHSFLDDVQDIKLPKKLLALEAELKSKKRITAVMDELQWTEWLETSTSPSRRRTLQQKVRKALDVSMAPDVTGKINVSLTFQWTRPDKAAAFVNRARDAWIKLVLDAHRRGVEVRKESAERVLLERESEYHAALAARQTYEKENQVPRLGDFETNNARKVSLLEKSITARAELESIVTQIVNLRAGLQLIEREIEVPLIPEDPQQALAFQKMQQMEAKFQDVAERYKQGSTAYNKAELDYQKARKALKELGGEPEITMTMDTNPAYAAQALALEAAQARELELKIAVATYEAELEEVDQNLERLPRVTADMARLSADVETAAELVTAAKLEIQPLREQAKALRSSQALVDQGAGQTLGGAPFEILEPGIEPETPVMPIGAILLALSLLVGVAVGLSGPVLTEFTRSSFGSVKEVSRNLGVPVLGAVDLILTTRDVRSRNVQSVLTITTMALVLVALGTALYIYAFHQEVLPPQVIRGIRDLKMALS